MEVVPLDVQRSERPGGLYETCEQLTEPVADAPLARVRALPEAPAMPTCCRREPTPNRSEFAMTDSELVAIAIAAIEGVTSPSIAAGMASAL